MAIAPDYAGGIQPAVGVGTEGARFKEQVAPRADFSPFFGAWKDVAGVAAKELDEANDALFTAKDAELRQYLIRQKQDKDTGFMNLHEENALKPDENGASLPDRVLSAASDYRESLMDGWSTAQKAAFRAKTNELLTQQYGVATDHLFKENEKYRVSASNARAAAASVNAQLNYTDPTAIEDALRVGEEEARKQSKIGGLTADDEEYAVRRMKGAIISKVISAAVDAAESDDQAIFTAKGIIGKYGKYLNPDDVIKLNAVIQKKFDSVEASQIGTDFFKKQVASRQSIFRVAASLFTTGADGKAVANPAAMDMQDISTYEQAHGVAQVFSNAIVQQESGGLHFDTDANGNKVVRQGKKKDGTLTGAFGLMQMTRGAYEYVEKKVYGREPTEPGWLRVKNTPELNKQYGTDYFALMLAQFGSVPKALAAYNAGPGRVSEAVKAYGADWLAHMPEETRGYVPQILNRLKSEQISGFTRSDGSKISALNSPQEFARQYYKQVPEAVIREQLRKQYPQLAASESKLDATVAVVVKKQKEAVDAFAVDQSNTTARLLEKFGATGQVDHSLLNRLTLQAQSEVMKIIKEREAGNVAGGDIMLLGRYQNNPADVFTNKATNQPVSIGEAKVIISQLPPEWQRDAAQKYAAMTAQIGKSRNDADMNLAALQGGFVSPGYDTTTLSSTKQALKTLDPDTFKDADKDDPKSLAVAVATNWAIAEAVAEAPGSKPPEPGTNEFNAWVAQRIYPKIEKKSFFSFLGAGPNKMRLIDYDPDDLPRNGPTSAGVLVDQMARDYYVRTGQMGADDKLTPWRKQAFFLRFFLMKNPGVHVDDPAYPKDKATWDYIKQKFDDDFEKQYHRKPNPEAGEKPDDLTVMREYIKIGARGERIPGKTPGDMPGGYISNGGAEWSDEELPDVNADAPDTNWNWGRPSDWRKNK